MFVNLVELKNKSIERHFRLIIVLMYNAINILIAIFLYGIIPIILNYAPGIIRGRKENVWFGISYTNQYLLIVLLCIFFGTIFILWTLRGSKRWDEVLSIDNQNEVVKIREKCFQLPYMIYLGQLMFPVIILPLILVSIKAPLVTTIKLVVIVFSFVSLVAVISLIFFKKLFLRVLLKTYKYNYSEGIKLGITTKIFLQIAPMFIVAILFTSLMGYSRVIEEKGDLLFKYYKEQLLNVLDNDSHVNYKKIQESINKIKKINSNENFFIITPKKEIITFDKSNLSKMFVNYISDLSDKYNGRVYNHSGDIQGVIVKLRVNGDTWIIGVKYEVASSKAIIFFLTNFLILLGIDVFVLFYFSKSISDDISLVARSLNELAEGEEIDLDKKIPVTSNDEIGDLVIAFNKIQELEKENLRKLKERHEMLIQSERLAALGQMVGGIAHNLKTPIVSIAGGTEALKDLINEYQESVDDLSVTKEDHLEIAGEMLDWIKEIKSHCAYMSDIISAVKEQSVQMNYSSGYSFTLEELVKRIEILMKYELKKYNCQMDMDLQVEMQTEIQGELNNLVQVFNNLINNAIQAYDEQGGKIQLKITTNQQRDLEFEIRDYGKGIAQEIRERLFKEMVTTKGTKGTGMGLYMSYLTIKGKFGGTIRFESEEGKGTVFHLTVPVSNGRNDMEVS